MNGKIQEAPCVNVGKVFVSIAFLMRADSLPSDAAVAGLPTLLCKEVAMIRESFVIETKTLYLRHFALLASRWRTSTLQRVCQRKRISF
jgi:hypothetical protein